MLSMNKLLATFIACCASLMLTCAAQAQSTADSSGRRTSLGADNLRWGAGFSTLPNSPALSGLLHFTELDSVQAVFGVGRTHDGTDLSAGGYYRHTLIGGFKEGLHVGGGAEVGVTDDDWYIGLVPLVGFHFTWPHVSNILLSVDGGARFSFGDGWSNFQLGPGGGALLAANIHYLF